MYDLTHRGCDSDGIRIRFKIVVTSLSYHSWMKTLGTKQVDTNQSDS
jgi:hypothetical protein